MSRKVFSVVACLLIAGSGIVLGYDLPSEWDWRELGAVSAVKNQGGCLSCWVFSAVGVVESRILIEAIEPFSPVDLSEQYVISCITDNDTGCSGGSQPGALAFMMDQGAISEECFPYQASDEIACDPCADDPIFVFDTYRSSYRPSGYPDELRARQIKELLVEYGPGAVMVEYSMDLTSYRGGVYRQQGLPGGGPYVGMLLVGYSDAGGYWILKNSWGPGWGESGFINIAYRDAMNLDYFYYLDGSVRELVCNDSDGDGYGDPGSPACQFGDETDCNDADPAVNPGAEEICDGVDTDCDGVIPPEETDQDLDGFTVCAGDCDDTDDSAYPGAVEIFDGVDNDCDEEVDEDFDDDGDGVPNFNDDCPDTPDGVGVGPDGCAVCFIDVSSDADGDGVDDSEDDCPESHLGGTVVIGDCDSGVENVLSEEGCTISDLVEGCAARARNHGAFVSCVGHVAIKLKREHVITGTEKGRLMKCAARSDLP